MTLCSDLSFDLKVFENRGTHSFLLYLALFALAHSSKILGFLFFLCHINSEVISINKFRVSKHSLSNIPILWGRGGRGGLSLDFLSFFLHFIIITFITFFLVYHRLRIVLTFGISLNLWFWLSLCHFFPSFLYPRIFFFEISKCSIFHLQTNKRLVST